MISTVEEARQYFEGDTYAMRTTGIKIEEAAENYARVSLEIGPGHMNAGGRVMGAVYFTMADFAFAVAANFKRKLTFTLASQISFMAPARGKILFAEAKCVTDGRHICYYEIKVTDDLRTEVALVTSNGYRMDQ
jgi:acyl-CoA thioesterase